MRFEASLDSLQVEKVVEKQVDVPQIQFVDEAQVILWLPCHLSGSTLVTILPPCEVVDIPMVKHRHVPTVVKQQKVGGVGPWVATGMACDVF